MNRKFSLGVAVAGLMLLAAPVAGAADASKEVGVAAVHAGLAAGAGDIAMVRMHLHHVVNCLAGPGGQGYDAAQMNPCKDMGAGAVVDAPADKKMALEAALGKAGMGLGLADLAAAKALAVELQGDLKKAM